LWAEFGSAGILGALFLAALALRAASRATAHVPAAVALAGYAVFSVADWQLDIPVFGFALAVCLTIITEPPPSASSPRARHVVGFVTLTALAVVAVWGRADPTPELNTRALALARSGTPASAAEAAALLRASLAQNPDQEIAHFNLGWLLLVTDAAAAERHFLAAARLVPDKGGVYFGLGLARLNQGQSAPAARALALECLNDPAFLSSPWWQVPDLAALRPATTAEFNRVSALAAASLPTTSTRSWAAAQLQRVSALAPRLGEVPPGPERSYRRERTAYPVLTRTPDLPPPLDLYDVRESAAPLTPDLPPKGWLPCPLLLQLLESPPPYSGISH
jgi:tetratricopeptide (TPR) repeat protein